MTIIPMMEITTVCPNCNKSWTRFEYPTTPIGVLCLEQCHECGIATVGNTKIWSQGLTNTENGV